MDADQFHPSPNHFHLCRSRPLPLLQSRNEVFSVPIFSIDATSHKHSCSFKGRKFVSRVALTLKTLAMGQEAEMDAIVLCRADAELTRLSGLAPSPHAVPPFVVKGRRIVQEFVRLTNVVAEAPSLAQVVALQALEQLID